MCIAIYKPADKSISKESLAQCFRANPDGAGFMYNSSRKLHVLKGFFTFAEFWEAYEPFQEEQCVIHFRIKTHGSIGIDNCHPFNITSNIGFVHNGIIPGYGIKEMSDTYHFNERVLKHLVNTYGRRTIFDEIMQDLFEEAIGWSKLIFLDNLGNVKITNEQRGDWDNGVWYSNASYKVPTYQVHRPYVRPEPAVILVPPSGTAVIPHGKQVLTKSNGLDIEVGDWVEIKYATRGLRKGEWVCVTKIVGGNAADVEDRTGVAYLGIASSYLEHPDYSDLQVPDYSTFRE